MNTPSSSLPNIRCGLLLCLPLLTAVLPAAHAALVIDTNDIADGAYTYTLNYNALMGGLTAGTNGQLVSSSGGAVANSFFQDAYSVSESLRVMSLWGGTRAAIGLQAGTSTGEFVYIFDFTDVGTTDGFTVVEPWRREIDGTRSTSYTSYYRVGESGDWIVISTSGSASGYQAAQGASAPVSTLTFEGAETVYYRVSITSSANINGGTANNPTGMLFDYVTNTTPDEQSFNISFNVASNIPEPSVFAMLMGAGSLGIAVISRRRRSPVGNS